MMPTPPDFGYDKVTTMFSPDGRLFQVEYARAAVGRGATAVGVKYGDGVVLAADKRITSRMVVPGSVEKLFQVDEHIGAVGSGLVADIRVLIDRLRVEAQVNRTRYNEPIDVALLTRRIGDYKQAYTQYGGIRPFGTGLLIAGVSPGPRLYETDPSGALVEYRAVAIGEGRRMAMEYLAEKYVHETSLEGAVMLVIKTLQEVAHGPLSEENLDIAVMDGDGYRKLKRREVKRYMRGLTGSGKAV